MYGHQSVVLSSPLSSLQLISKHARETEKDQETWELNNIRLSFSYHDTPGLRDTETWHQIRSQNS